MAEDIAGKPKVGAPCNSCGLCCVATKCSVGIQLHGPAEVACPSLEYRDGHHWCGAESTVKHILGIGTGCDSGDQWEVLFKHG